MQTWQKFGYDGTHAVGLIMFEYLVRNKTTPTFLLFLCFVYFFRLDVHYKLIQNEFKIKVSIYIK